MEKIDIGKIRGRWEERDIMNRLVGGGDDTIESIKMVAEKVNEVVEWINKLSGLKYE